METDLFKEPPHFTSFLRAKDNGMELPHPIDIIHVEEQFLRRKKWLEALANKYAVALTIQKAVQAPNF